MSVNNVNVFDVAEYILRCVGPTSTIKLQKLVYYSQAWSLVWDDDVLFDEEIQAWANGPVVPALFFAHQGEFKVEEGAFHGDPDKLNEEQRNTVDIVLEFYGSKSSQWLSDLTHSEDPWRNARRGIPDGERGDREITPEAMLEYYSNLK